MKLAFENLGAMESAVIALAPLTVICGENNTGKTYATYAIYTLLSLWTGLVESKIPEATLTSLQRDGAVSIDLQEEIVAQWETIKQATCKNWKYLLSSALAAAANRFDDTVLSFDFELDRRWLARPFESVRRSEQGKIVFVAKKLADSPHLTISALRDPSDPPLPPLSLAEFVREDILAAVFGAYIPRVFMASAERTGAAIFKDELSLKNYALPILDNIRFLKRLSALEGRPGGLIKTHPELIDGLKAIAGGGYATNRDGISTFTPQGTTASLSLTEASSAARSLLILWYWLIGVAAKGDTLMIDEPELNLHPANQCKMARWIARLVNCGVRVFVTTHSDYFVKELNTLIMFDQRTQAIRRIADESGYVEEEFLKLDDVRLYVCQKGDFQQCGSTEKTAGMTLAEAGKSARLGLEASTFDITINAMNALQDRLYYAPPDEAVKEEAQ